MSEFVTIKANTRSLNEAIGQAIGLKLHLASGVVRKVATDLTRDLQLQAPVLTGRLRAGFSPFLLSVGVPVSEGPDGAAVASGRAAGEFTDDTKRGIPHVAVLNGVEYASVINEQGSQKVDPQWFERTLSRFDEHLRREVKV